MCPESSKAIIHLATEKTKKRNLISRNPYAHWDRGLPKETCLLFPARNASYFIRHSIEKEHQFNIPVVEH